MKQIRELAHGRMLTFSLVDSVAVWDVVHEVIVTTHWDARMAILPAMIGISQETIWLAANKQ